MARFILNADDFGRSLERNRAIDDSFKQGIVYSAGLIVTGKYLFDAVELMHNGGYIQNIHLHFNLSTSQRGGNPEDTPLTEDLRRDSLFCQDDKFINYRGLPKRIKDVWKWKVVYKELIAQYEKFKEITDGKANYKHVDFHLWYNLTWPVSIALNLFTRKFKIESVRYLGLHQIRSRRYKLYRLLSWNPRVRYVPATNIDYYLTKRDSLAVNNLMELYCHPNYKDGVFLDDSPSYLGHERQPMLKHIQMLKKIGINEFLSWKDV